MAGWNCSCNLTSTLYAFSEKRASWLIGWFEKILDTGSLELEELAEVVGRMLFTYGALPYDLPFLAPLYQLSAHHGRQGSVRIPLYVRMTLSWLHDRLVTRRVATCAPVKVNLGNLFRVDAKAEGQEVVIGGWKPRVMAESGKVCSRDSDWFAVTLTQESAPWAFYKGEPYRAISALELMATAVALVVFGVPEARHADAHGYGSVMLSTGTDSQVASRVIDKGIAKTYPMCCVAMEIAALQEHHNLWVHSCWTPRDRNSEADALTNGDYRDFDLRHRVQVDIRNLPWLVLPGLLSTGLAWHGRRQEREPRREVQPRDGRRRPLRERDPW